MWIANLIVLVVVLGCVAYQYSKGTFVKAFAMLMAAILSTIVAFGFYEVLANVFIGRGSDSKFSSFEPWAQSTCLLLLFVLAFAIFQTIAAQLARQPVDLGFIPERAGRVVFGLFLGFVVASMLLTTLAMAPLPYKYPYPRFEKDKPNPARPQSPVSNIDGFAPGLFTMVSDGSFSGEKSFDILHADFLDQAFLNRNPYGKNVKITAGSQAIELYKVQRKSAAWPAPEALKNAADPNELVVPKSGKRLTVVRVGLSRKLARGDGAFAFSQLRIVCKPADSTEQPLSGEGFGVYPFGYLKAPGQIQLIKRLSDTVNLKTLKFDDNIKWIDFVFELKQEYQPVLVEFKQNNVTQILSVVSSEQSPPAVYFSPRSND